MCAMRAQRRRRVSTPRRPLAGRLIHRLSRSRRISRPPKRVVCAYYPPSYATGLRHKPRPADKPAPLAPGPRQSPPPQASPRASFLLPASPPSKRAGRKAPLPDRPSCACAPCSLTLARRAGAAPPPAPRRHRISPARRPHVRAPCPRPCAPSIRRRHPLCRATRPGRG